MNCCGDSRQRKEEIQEVPEPTPFLVVTQQPRAHTSPTLHTNGSNISPPPAVLNGVGDGYDPQKMQMTEQWAASHKGRPPSISSSRSGSRTMPPTYTPLLSPNIIRPNPIHALSASPMTMTPSITSKPAGSPLPPADEGRISVAIDFGTSHPATLFICSCLCRYNIFWCCVYLHLLSNLTILIRSVRRTGLLE